MKESRKKIYDLHVCVKKLKVFFQKSDGGRGWGEWGWWVKEGPCTIDESLF